MRAASAGHDSRTRRARPEVREDAREVGRWARERRFSRRMSLPGAGPTSQPSAGVLRCATSRMLSMRDETPRSLKSDLLNAPNRLGASVIELVAADVAEHGEGVIAALRQQNPAACHRVPLDHGSGTAPG